MNTIIDNNQRVFLITRLGFSVSNYFCNLKDIPSCLADLEKHDSFKIYHFWDKKFSILSKKRLNEMFAANQIDFKL